jgi:hypothetical protein
MDGDGVEFHRLGPGQGGVTLGEEFRGGVDVLLDSRPVRLVGTHDSSCMKMRRGHRCGEKGKIAMRTGRMTRFIEAYSL